MTATPTIDDLVAHLETDAFVHLCEDVGHLPADELAQEITDYIQGWDMRETKRRAQEDAP